MTFHVLGIPYVATKKENSLCAFTIKVLQFCEQMTKRGHKVLFYGHKDSKVICSEHITVTNDEILALSYKNLDWKNQGFNQNVDTDAFKIFNQNCIREIKKRISHENEFLCLFFGYGNLSVAEAFKNQLIVVEASIGYNSMFAPIKIFETYSHQSWLYGKEQKNPELCNNWVVYPGFNENDFVYREKKDNYSVMCARLTIEKGTKVAYDLFNFLEEDLILIGPNLLKLPDTKWCKFIGFLEPQNRNEIISRAKLSMCPSLFVDPTNWSCIESQFCGTPVISTNWGGFVETNIQGVTGYRFSDTRLLPQLVKNINKIQNQNCLNNARNKFLLKTQMDNYESLFLSICS